MAVKIKLGRPTTSIRDIFANARVKRLLRYALAGAALVVLFFMGIAAYYYHRYELVVDKRLTQPLFANTAKIYAAPREVRVGQKLTVNGVAQELRQAGYTDATETHASAMGTFQERPGSIYIHPGPQSYHTQDGATINFSPTGLVTKRSPSVKMYLNCRTRLWARSGKPAWRWSRPRY